MYWCLYRKVCRGFHGGLLEKARAEIQFTANYIYLFYYIMQHTVAVHVGTEAMMWLNRALNMATDWSKVWATQARRETDKVTFILLTKAHCTLERACILLSCALIG